VVPSDAELDFLTIDFHKELAPLTLPDRATLSFQCFEQGV
jgi:hypothetical protein